MRMHRQLSTCSFAPCSMACTTLLEWWYCVLYNIRWLSWERCQRISRLTTSQAVRLIGLRLVITSH